MSEKFTAFKDQWKSCNSMGISQEEATANECIQWKADNGSPGVRVDTKCSLANSSAYPWLAVTPNSFVIDPQWTFRKFSLLQSY